jgi:hypothetical protein
MLLQRGPNFNTPAIEQRLIFVTASPKLETAHDGGGVQLTPEHTTGCSPGTSCDDRLLLLGLRRVLDGRGPSPWAPLGQKLSIGYDGGL